MNIMMLIMGMFACSEKETDTATTDTSAEPSGEPLAFIGSWEDNYGTLLDVTESDIIDNYGNGFSIDSYSNEEQYVIAQNGSDNTYNPDLWSKFEWTTANDELYYCQIAYDAADAETAMDATADANDVEAGCNGFGWSILTLAE